MVNIRVQNGKQPQNMAKSRMTSCENALFEVTLGGFSRNKSFSPQFVHN